MSIVQLNPRLRKAIVGTLCSVLYGSITEQYSNKLKNLIQHNSRAWGNTQLCIAYKGETYGTKNYTTKTLPRPINRVHPSMREAFKDFFAEINNDEREQNFIQNFLADLATFATSLETYRQVLPEELHSCLGRYNYFPTAFTPASEEPSEVIAYIEKNAVYIHMIKQRMIKNLLVQ